MRAVDLYLCRSLDPSLSPSDRREAYSRVVVAYQDAAFGAAYAILKDRQAAEDAALMAFVDCWRSLESLRDRAAFGPWLRSSVRSRAYKLLRSRLPVSSIEAYQTVAASEDGAVVPWIAVKLALAGLPENEREIVVLHHLVGLQRGEAAALLGISEIAVKKRLERAFARLRKDLPDMNEPEIKQGLPSHSDSFRSTAILLAGEFAELLASHTPILDALDQCVARAGTGPVRSAFQEMRAQVTMGKPMADAMLNHPEVFAPEDARLVLSGEEQGTLHIVMRQLA